MTAGNQLVTNIFKALAHPTRIWIMKLLKNGPLCVCDIVNNLRSEQSNTSQHLNVLKNAGLVENRKEGLSVLYYTRSLEIYDVIDAVEKILLEQAADPEAMQMIMYSKKDTGEHIFTAHEGGITKEQLMSALKEMGLKE